MLCGILGPIVLGPEGDALGDLMILLFFGYAVLFLKAAFLPYRRDAFRSKHPFRTIIMTRADGTRRHWLLIYVLVLVMLFAATAGADALFMGACRP